MSGVEARGVIRRERVGPGINQLKLPPEQDLRLRRGGIHNVDALKTAIKEGLLPNRIGPKSLKIIRKALNLYAKQARR